MFVGRLWIIPILVLCIACNGANAPGTDAATLTGDAVVDGTGDGGGQLALGERCDSPDDCASGECTNLHGMANDTYCTASCAANDTACPENGLCYVPGDFAGVCVRPCQLESDCAGDLTCDVATSPPPERGCL
jgi:hypothetical protein